MQRFNHYTAQSFLRQEQPALFETAADIRTRVFVQEQQCTPEEEFDSYEDISRHWLILDTETELGIATCRMRSYQQACQTQPVGKMERIAVLADYRGQKLGDWLVRLMIAEAKTLGHSAAYMHAQTHALEFYQRFGFQAEGFEFEEAGIPHIAMRALLP